MSQCVWGQLNQAHRVCFGVMNLTAKICQKCGAEVDGWDIEYHKQYGKWRLKPHFKKGSNEYCVRPLGAKRIQNPTANTTDPSHPDYVTPDPCKACRYYGRTCYPNQEHCHYANW